MEPNTTRNIHSVQEFKTMHPWMSVRTIKVRGFIPKHNKGLVLAMERIAEAREGKTNELVLAGLGLTEIPDEVFNLTELTSLIISDNRITVIPDKIGKLDKLKIIAAFNNPITEIHNNIGLLKDLHTLLLQNCSFSKFPKGILSLTKLANLNLANNKIKWVPTTLKDLNIEEIDLSGNPLLNVPKQFHITTSARLFAYDEEFRIKHGMEEAKVLHVAINSSEKINKEWVNQSTKQLEQIDKLSPERGYRYIKFGTHDAESLYRRIEANLDSLLVLHLLADKLEFILTPDAYSQPFLPDDLTEMFSCMKEPEFKTKLLILDFENGGEFAEKFIAPDFNLILYKNSTTNELDVNFISYLFRDLSNGVSIGLALNEMLTTKGQPYKLTYRIKGKLEDNLYVNLTEQKARQDISPGSLAHTLMRHVLSYLYPTIEELYGIVNKILTRVPVSDSNDPETFWNYAIDQMKKFNKLEEFLEIVKHDKPFSANLLNPLLDYL